MKKETINFITGTIMVGNSLLVGCGPGRIPIGQASHSRPDYSDLAHFKKEVKDDTENVRGVYIKGLLALQVLQQPAGKAAYVTEIPNAVSQFRMAESQGSVGFLAHEWAAGKDFSKIKKGTRVDIIYGNGVNKEYEVTGVRRFKALTPSSTTSEFVEVNENKEPIGKKIKAKEVFAEIYSVPGRLIFQTCIDWNGEEPGEESGGRLFVTAEEIKK